MFDPKFDQTVVCAPMAEPPEGVPINEIHESRTGFHVECVPLVPTTTACKMLELCTPRTWDRRMTRAHIVIAARIGPGWVSIAHVSPPLMHKPLTSQRVHADWCSVPLPVATGAELSKLALRKYRTGSWAAAVIASTCTVNREGRVSSRRVLDDPAAPAGARADVRRRARQFRK